MPLRVGVTMLCGCATSQNGPWRASDTEVEAFATIDGNALRRVSLRFDTASALFRGDVTVNSTGLHKVKLRSPLAATKKLASHVQPFRSLN